MGGAVSTGENNDELIDNLLEADYIKSQIIERVFRAVDRAHYLTSSYKHHAYKDLAWKDGHLHLSAPCIYSKVMESLKLSAGLSFLNLGSGTGYLSTMVGLILGPYGVNHGVEIHKEVVQYANLRLEEFWNKASALDENEFCKPLFINGNCLNLNADEHQYDRVYCGAACPENHENYMKNLLKIGGVLVMPLNEQLMQITRISETAWKEKSVLPVSFASLLPKKMDLKEHVTLPDREPLSLQDACRTTIRCILRYNIEIEHPNLTTKNIRRPKNKAKRNLHRLVIPIFENSDGEMDTNEDHNIAAHPNVIYNMESQDDDETPDNLGPYRDIQHRISNLARVNAVMALISQIEDDDEDEEEEEEARQQPPEVEEPMPTAESSNSTTVAEQRKIIPKREKFDSGLGEEIVNGKCHSSDDDIEDENNDSDDGEAMETNGSDSDTSDDNGSNFQKFIDQLNNSESRKVNGRKVASDQKDTDNCDNSESTVNTDTYSHYMKYKIQALPLPQSLKNFINLYRNF